MKCKLCDIDLLFGKELETGFCDICWKNIDCDCGLEKL